MKQRNLRKKRALDEDEEPEDVAEQADGQPKLTAEDIKLLQKQRQRRTGVEASTLMVAAADSRAAKSKAGPVGPALGQDVLQAAFKRERRLYSEEEDPNMKKYIEEQLAKRMGRPSQAAEEEAQRLAAEERARRVADPLLAALPEGLEKRQQDAELGPSWVAGLTEVPLTLEQKLANIEATEAAKKQMLAVIPDDDYEQGGTGGAGLRRGQYPVSFGRQDPKMLQVVAEAQARKARMRALQEEKKKQKKEEFAGW